jgi:hypothetical protein
MIVEVVLFTFSAAADLLGTIVTVRVTRDSVYLPLAGVTSLLAYERDNCNSYY